MDTLPLASAEIPVDSLFWRTRGIFAAETLRKLSYWNFCYRERENYLTICRIVQFDQLVRVASTNYL
jgi:hypothetical protein